MHLLLSTDVQVRAAHPSLLAKCPQYGCHAPEALESNVSCHTVELYDYATRIVALAKGH